MTSPIDFPISGWRYYKLKARARYCPFTTATGRRKSLASLKAFELKMRVSGMFPSVILFVIYVFLSEAKVSFTILFCFTICNFIALLKIHDRFNVISQSLNEFLSANFITII